MLCAASGSDVTVRLPGLVPLVHTCLAPIIREILWPTWFEWTRIKLCVSVCVRTSLHVCPCSCRHPEDFPSAGHRLWLLVFSILSVSLLYSTSTHPPFLLLLPLSCCHPHSCFPRHAFPVLSVFTFSPWVTRVFPFIIAIIALALAFACSLLLSHLQLELLWPLPLIESTPSLSLLADLLTQSSTHHLNLPLPSAPTSFSYLVHFKPEP